MASIIPHPPLSPHSGEFDTNCIRLNTQPIYKIKSSCQIVFHWFQLFILAQCMFIPQPRGGWSVKPIWARLKMLLDQYKNERMKQNSAGSTSEWIVWVTFTKYFPALQQTKILGKLDFHVKINIFSIMSSYFKLSKLYYYKRPWCLFSMAADLNKYKKVQWHKDVVLVAATAYPEKHVSVMLLLAVLAC